MKPEKEEELGVQLSVTLCVAGATPKPESEMVVGEFVALLEMATVPVTLPAALGAKSTAKEVD